MPPVVLPNFLIIGAPRSGTTSLCQYLKQHPDVYLSAKKEPRYFAFGERELDELGGPGARFLRETTVRTWDAYVRLFRGAVGHTAIGEASPRYLWARGAAERISARLPETKIIAILRQPADRAYGGYLGALRDGREAADTFEQALSEERRREEAGWAFGVYTRPSWYHRHLSSYYERFPRRRIRVVLFEEFERDPGAVVRQLFEFLEVDPGVAVDVSRRHGRSGVIRNPIARTVWKLSRRIPEPVRSLLPPAVRDRSLERLTRDVVRPPLAPETRRALTARFRDDIRALEKLIGRDLSSWLGTEAGTSGAQASSSQV